MAIYLLVVFLAIWIFPIKIILTFVECSTVKCVGREFFYYWNLLWNFRKKMS